MAADAPHNLNRRRLALCLSLLAPGLGQAVTREPAKALRIVLVTGTLLLGTWGLWTVAGVGAAVFCFLLLGLPWWAFQSFDAWLGPSADGAGRRLQDAWLVAWQRAHDIRFLGLLFLVTAATDGYIILANPTYALTLFCAKPEGIAGLLAKAQSPTLHVAIGYGFLRLRRWSLLLYLAYAGFGLVNALANFACFGYGRVRTLFLVTLAAFTLYVLWRAPCFDRGQQARTTL